MPRFNLELFKPLILNFEYIHSKRRKLGMFKILFRKCQICLSKLSKFATNSPNSFIFNFWLRDMSRDHNETLTHKKTWRFTFGGKFILFCLLAIDIANHSYAQNTPLLQALNPLSRHKSAETSLYFETKVRRKRHLLVQNASGCHFLSRTVFSLHHILELEPNFVRICESSAWILAELGTMGKLSLGRPQPNSFLQLFRDFDYWPLNGVSTVTTKMNTLLPKRQF